MRALIIEHQADAPAGLLGEALDARGLPARVARIGDGDALPEPSSVAVAISLGSDASVHASRHDWIAIELDWLRAADRAGVALLGLCFGAQALARALGGSVARAAGLERGWITVTSERPGLIAPGPWLAWHEDVFTPPRGAQLLAHNEVGPQAFQLGRHLGLQFHPEVTPEIIGDWIANSREGEVDDAEASALRKETAQRFEAARAAAMGLFDAYLDLALGPRAS